MFIHLLPRLIPGRLRPAILLIVVALLGGCELSIGGPESAAITYVRSLVDATQETPEQVKVYSHLPNRVIIEYARALKAQGIDMKYSARKLSGIQDDTIKIAVTITPRRSQKYNERQHTLLLTLKKDGKQGWGVIGVSASP